MSRYKSEKKSKPRPDLIPARALDALGHVFAFGLEKHGHETWRDHDARDHIASAMRHLVEYLIDSSAVEETSGRSVLWHAASQLMIAIECERVGERVCERVDTETTEVFGGATDPPPICDVFIDLDGVLVDLVRGVGLSPNALIEYGAFADQGGLERAAHLTREQWAELPELPRARELVALASKAADVRFLSRALWPEALSGKSDWLALHDLDPQALVTIGRWSKKAIAASPTALLIDDHEEEIDAWRERGGPAFLWPAPWNRFRREGSKEDLEDLAVLLAERCVIS